ncbi:hypothetical protein FJT64_003721 [Amphibalanus amphitrite]|uniref:Uncharacterized protein n=1 Tax=Amphibalanus amphitrite TaxID=1232801 RepID=A0A6A4W5H2_AMPAM|nr:uncharacterized protein LOC122385447 [Amphibalanus amphitrite]XP_043229676.1 uncharacterized protein LOC122385447 [Amphibalanus amphitrite]KAF0298950.1 hypothetical protein FJT64_003721 [Amphibalanus amphitrite]
MPRRKVTKKKDTENDQKNEKLEALLKQFDMEVDRRVYEMHRATEQTCAHIDGMFKLARLKIPSAFRSELFENIKKDDEQEMAKATDTLSAVDAILDEAERTVRQRKPAARGRGTGRATRAASSAAPPSALVTPLQPLRPLHASTPAVTPKFDPLTVQRQAPSTIRRHRPREVLMSLKGSPVMADTAGGAEPVAETKQIVQQAVELLRQEEDLDEETRQLMASLRDQLNDLTASVNKPI